MRHLGQYPPAGLVVHGPTIHVIFALHPADRARAVAVGAPPVDAIRGHLMIDTGAQRTLVDEQIAQRLGLRAIDVASIVGVSGVAETRPVYRLAVVIGMADKNGVTAQVTFATDVVGMVTMHHPACAGLLGRDFLRHFRFVYDGPSGIIELVKPGTVPAIAGPKLGRNDPCPCGSGKKYKACHGR